MKKTYQKPACEIMLMEQEQMIAASDGSLGIFDDSTMDASDALSNEESNFNVWQ